jgi:pilus assembly protein Flp/PilA
MLLRFQAKVQGWWNGLRDRAREQRGASAVEYGLIVALIAAVIVVVVGVLGRKVSNAFQSVAATLP